jgi:hypothetical protein
VFFKLMDVSEENTATVFRVKVHEQVLLLSAVSKIGLRFGIMEERIAFIFKIGGGLTLRHCLSL